MRSMTIEGQGEEVNDSSIARIHMAMASLKQACVMMSTFDERTCYPALRRILNNADEQIQDAIIYLDLEAADAKPDDR